MNDTTRTIYQRLHANLALAELYARNDQAVPVGLRLEIEHDEALLAMPEHAEEAQRLDDAQAMHDARMAPRRNPMAPFVWATLALAAGLGLLHLAERWGWL